MADVHGERALLNHCDAHGLRRAARPTPCNHAYSSTAPLVPGETRPTTPRSPHWDPRLWRGALAGSHSPARGALRVLPLGGRATTVRAPLPLGYLPTCVMVQFFFAIVVI